MLKAVSWIYRLPSKYVHFVGYAFLTTNLCFFLTTFCLDSHLMKIKILNKLDYCQEAMSFVSKPIQGKPLGCSINRLLPPTHLPTPFWNQLEDRHFPNHYGSFGRFIVLTYLNLLVAWVDNKLEITVTRLACSYSAFNARKSWEMFVKKIEVNHLNSYRDFCNHN